jgi:serine/threonine protein kinase
VGKARKWTKDDFVIGKCLGRGKYGTVHIAREKKLNFIVALKIMNKSDLKEPNA